MTWPPATHQDVKDQIDLKLAITDASATYVTLAGTETVTGAKTFTSTLAVGDGTGSVRLLKIDGAASALRLLGYYTAGSARWFVGTIGTESGSNAGADLSFGARDDAGADLGSRMVISRATGDVTLAAGFGFSPSTTTTAPSAGGAGALPATPLGYFSVTIGGNVRKVAYY